MLTIDDLLKDLRYSLGYFGSGRDLYDYVDTEKYGIDWKTEWKNIHYEESERSRWVVYCETVDEVLLNGEMFYIMVLWEDPATEAQEGQYTYPKVHLVDKVEEVVTVTKYVIKNIQ